jgi:hypothetical protein
LISKIADYVDDEPLKAINNGDSDVSTDGTPSQFLLFRGLDASISEEVLAKGAAKLYKVDGEDSIRKAASKSVIGASDGSIKRVLLARSRDTGECWRFGFAEFSNPSVSDLHAYQKSANSDSPRKHKRP